ncbi:MAG: glycosyltransferase family 4 protein [Chitinivibrionales bacterium]|nr:glycosyltransferase family 4 protein [Chitinivibrionales bacterium]
MKIALITHQFPPSIGGTQQWNRQMARAFALAGHTVDVYHVKCGLKPHNDPLYRYIGVSLNPKADIDACEKTRYTLGFVLRLLAFFARYGFKLARYDAWQVCFGEPVALKLFLLMASFFLRVKLVVVSGCVIFRHPYRNPFMRSVMFALAEAILKRAALILVDGKDIRDEIAHRGIPAARIRVCYAGVDTALFKGGSRKPDLVDFARKKGLALDPAMPVVLYCARFSYENAPLNFISSVNGMQGVQAVMIGNGDLLSEVKKRIAGMDTPVHLWGSLAYADLPLIFGAIDVCIYPYSKYIGGISQVIPLTMACGGCVITTLIGDNKALIEPGKNGFLCEEDDTQTMREIAQQILDKKIDAAAIKSAARKTIVEHWSLTARDKMYAEIIGELQG